jgi:hypothetical protein
MAQALPESAAKIWDAKHWDLSSRIPRVADVRRIIVACIAESSPRQPMRRTLPFFLREGAQRHGETSTRNAANDRSPIHHWITSLTTGSPTILRFERGFTPVGHRPVVAGSCRWRSPLADIPASVCFRDQRQAVVDPEVIGERPVSGSPVKGRSNRALAATVRIRALSGVPI